MRDIDERDCKDGHADAQQAEIDRLTDCLTKANSQAEHFERQWYLRGDAIEAMRESAAALLWRELIDWCATKQLHPSNHNELFSICSKIRGLPLEATE